MKSKNEIIREIDERIVENNLSRPMREDEDIYFIKGDRYHHHPEDIIVVSKYHHERLVKMVRNYQNKLVNLTYWLFFTSSVVVIFLIILVKIYLKYGNAPLDG